MHRRNIKFAILAVASLSLAGIWQVGNATDKFLPDDGTYREITVKSFEECAALCRADSKICRGQSMLKNSTKPLVICRLNNGFGANPLFPSKPPTPLNINIALADLNAYRHKFGLSPVVLNDKLSAASQIHADDLALYGNMSHTGSDGSDVVKRIQRQDYNFRVVAENVAAGQESWEIVFKAWQESPGHNKNLLQPNVTDFGIALVYEPKTTYQTYWSMIVAAPLGEPQIYYTVPSISNGIKTH